MFSDVENCNYVALYVNQRERKIWLQVDIIYFPICWEVLKYEKFDRNVQYPTIYYVYNLLIANLNKVNNVKNVRGLCFGHPSCVHSFLIEGSANYLSDLLMHM